MKNTFKRIAAFATAGLMTVSLAVPALAADITIANPLTYIDDEGNETAETYTAYKVFSATQDGTAYGYILDSTSDVYDALIAANEAQDSFSLVATEAVDAEGKTIYNPTVTDAPAFAAYLNSLELTGGIEAVDGKISVPEGQEGYYFVDTNVGSLCDLTTATADVTIYDKNEVPEIDKTVDDIDLSVYVGQVLTYTISGEVPSTTGYDEYVYTVNDTMSEGLTFNKDVTNTLDADVEAEYDGNSFKITFDMTKYEVGTEFTITYTATVNEDAVELDAETNTATLTYSNDPGDETSTDTNPPVIVKVYTASIDITKVDANNNETKLAGAKFVLKNAEGKYYLYTPAVMSETTEEASAAVVTPASVSWVDSQDDATEVTTDENGAASFDGLEDGTYYLVETAAPTGYNLLADAVTVVVKGDDAEIAKIDATPVVENSKGSILPSTGGIGTTIFYIIGGCLVAAAVVVLVVKRRRAE